MPVRFARSDRKLLILAIFIATGFIYLARIFYLQVINKSYATSANNNVLRYVTQYPARGLIYDRNGKVLVVNEAVYDLMVVPREAKHADTAQICSLLGLSKEDYIKRMETACKYSMMLPSAFEKQISKETYGYLQEKLYRLQGFYVQPRTIRKYPRAVAAHLLGYVGEVTPGYIEKNPYYKQGDYIGVNGLERTYEKELRGIKGMKIRMVDVHNRDVGSFEKGAYDTAAVMGSDLYTGIDLDLQEYGEQLLANKKGSAIAIEPQTGEILCFISSPTYDPNLLVGRVRSKNFAQLNNDSITKPLYNRAIMGLYPPGSTFKMAVDLVGLQMGVITPNTYFSCQGPESWPIKCTHYHGSPLNVYSAIEQSCNPFHFQVFKAILNDPRYSNIRDRYDVWYKHLFSMGFGHSLKTDLAYELNGYIPTVNFYDKTYDKRWNTMTVRSLSIGQGEILTTPVQLVNYAGMIANRGFYYPPHVVRSVGNMKNKTPFSTRKNISSIDAAHYDVIKKGMELVVERGTATAAKLDNIAIAGKTGTVQNPHGGDHSLFIGYAPAGNPKIAICVVIENAGYGSTYAAPIASLMIEKYLMHTVTHKENEERFKNMNLLYGSRKK